MPTATADRKKENIGGQVVEQKESWDELFEWGKRLKECTGLTREDSAKILASVRRSKSGDRG